MATVSFPFSVKYKGRWYAPYASISADDSDVDKLANLGAKVVTRSAEALEKASEKVATKSTARQAKTTPQKKR